MGAASEFVLCTVGWNKQICPREVSQTWLCGAILHSENVPSLFLLSLLQKWGAVCGDWLQPTAKFCRRGCRGQCPLLTVLPICLLWLGLSVCLYECLSMCILISLVLKQCHPKAQASLQLSLKPRLACLQLLLGPLFASCELGLQQCAFFCTCLLPTGSCNLVSKMCLQCIRICAF